MAQEEEVNSLQLRMATMPAEGVSANKNRTVSWPVVDSLCYNVSPSAWHPLFAEWQNVEFEARRNWVFDLPEFRSWARDLVSDSMWVLDSKMK